MQVKEYRVNYVGGRQETFDFGYLLVPYEKDKEIAVIDKLCYNVFGDIATLIINISKLSRSIEKDIKKFGLNPEDKSEEIVSIETVDAFNETIKYDKAILFSGLFNDEGELYGLFIKNTPLQNDEISTMIATAKDHGKKLRTITKKLREK